MYKLTLLFSVLFILNTNTNTNKDHYCLHSEQKKLESLLFLNAKNLKIDNFDIDYLEIVELEEEVELGFETKNYVPENFNA